MKRLLLALIFVGIALATIAAFSALPKFADAPPRKIAPQRDETPLPNTGPVVRIKDLVIPVEIADSAEERSRGLSGRASLAPERGMLFLFPSPGYYSFWMPNMHFPIDIIWIGPDRRIVDIAEHIPPESYPRRFSPRAPAQYVLEVNAGFSAAHNIQIGDPVTLP